MYELIRLWTYSPCYQAMEYYNNLALNYAEPLRISLEITKIVVEGAF